MLMIMYKIEKTHEKDIFAAKLMAFFLFLNIFLGYESN